MELRGQALKKGIALQKILITGAAGRIGQKLAKHLEGRYELILCDQKTTAENASPPILTIDTSDFAAFNQVFKQHSDIHTVIHLAADPRTTAVWESLLPNNIVGAYNVFEAAQQANVKRILFASSINAVDGYEQDVQVKTSMPVAPANLYGATKAWGEALGRFYADYKDMQVHCLRIGWVVEHDDERIQIAPHELLHMTTSYRDLLHFFDACIDSKLNFAVWHVTSDNYPNRLDISDSKAELSYQPQDDGFELRKKA